MSKIIFNGIDYAGGSGNYFNPIIYSDVERKVGVWRDNKPLYQKTVHINALPSSATSQTYAHNIANIDKICNYYGIGRASSGSSVLLNRVGMSGSNVNGAISYDLYVNKTNITVSVGQDRSGIEADVTIWYTKTTDIAGSGDYNTYGVPTVHYSTSEQVIGTWINGKPIYQRTWDFSGSPIMTPYAQWVDTGISASVNIDKIISAESRYGTAVNSGIEFGAGAGGFVVGAEKYDPINNTRGIDQLTLRYTKTTD